MAINEKRRGRPTFAIDRQRLCELRKEVGLTQLALAKGVYSLLGKPATSDAVMKSSYQRWEKKGRMTRQTAEWLAKVLKTTVAVLQGADPEPPVSRVEEIESRIRALAEVGHPALVGVLAAQAETHAPYRELAVQLAERLEAAQLTQERSEWERLSTLLEWSMDDLQRPTNVHGHWLLVRNERGVHSNEIFHGILDLLYEVRKVIADFLDMHESDARISFKEEGLWFRIHVAHPRFLQLSSSLSFVRCQAAETGLRWIRPTWRDRFWIDALPREAHDLANFVSGFDVLKYPEPDLLSLRLAIFERRSPQGTDEAVEGKLLATTKGVLTELAERIPMFKREGSSHDAIMNWLSSDLAETLLPFLADWPIKSWELLAACGRIDVTPYPSASLAFRSSIEPGIVPVFRVVLVEQAVTGSYRTMPWRRQSVETVLKRLRGGLDQLRAQLPASGP